MKSQKNTTVRFEDFELSNELTRAITELGFETPSPVQEQTIPLLMEGATDFLGLAGTGTGKTAAFAIPILENMDPNARGVQALILCPTRELAKQVSEQINLLARYKKTKALAIYGGSNYSGQIRALKDGVSIVVGTPGRIIDHLDRGTLNLDSLQTVVLDEADEMISMGFKDEIETILERVNQKVKHQTWLFSATMSDEIRRIADQFLTKPKQVKVNKTTETAGSVSQFYFKVFEEQKNQMIENLIDTVDGFYGLIFCQTKVNVTELTQSLKNKGYPVDCLHGDMEQNAREKTLKSFKAKECTILVCTDVASRGIDVKDLTHVINFSLPREMDLYIHRIGRTGRGGKDGIAWSLVTPSHNWLLGRIEQETGTKLMPGKLPTPAEVIRLKVGRKLVGFMPADASKSKTVVAIEESLTETGWSEVIANMTKEEIVARFLSREIKLIDATPRPEPKFEVGKGGFAGKKFGKPGFGKPGFKKGGFAKSFKTGGFKKDGFKKPAFKSGEKMKPIAPRA